MYKKIKEDLKYILENGYGIGSVSKYFLDYFENSISKAELTKYLNEIDFYWSHYIQDINYESLKQFLATLKNTEYENRIYEILFYANDEILFISLQYESKEIFYQDMKGNYNIDLNFIFLKYSRYSDEKQPLFEVIGIENIIDNLSNPKEKISLLYYMAKYHPKNIGKYSDFLIEKFKNEYTEYLQKKSTGYYYSPTFDITNNEISKIFDYFENKIELNKININLSKNNNNYCDKNYGKFSKLFEIIEKYNFKYFLRIIKFEKEILHNKVFSIFSNNQCCQPIENLSKYGYTKEELNIIALEYYETVLDRNIYNKGKYNYGIKYLNSLDKKSFYNASKEKIGEFSSEVKCCFANDFINDIEIFEICFDNIKSSKELKNTLIDKAKTLEKKEIINFLKNKLENKSVKHRENAIDILVELDIENIKELLNQHLQKERSKKLKEKIINYLEKFEINPALKEFLKLLSFEDKKLINKLGESLLPVKDLSGNELPIEYSAVLVSFFINYYKPVTYYEFKDSIEKQNEIEKFIDKESIFKLAKSIYSWFKDRNFSKNNLKIGYFAIINADLELIKEIKKDIEEINKKSRRDFAEYLFIALTWNKAPIIDFLDYSIKNIKNKYIVDRAKNQLRIIAYNENTTVEELLDSLIPNFNLDKYGSRIFSYGSREFKVTLINNEQLEVLDIEKNKVLKNLPKTNKTDNEIIAENSQEEFKQLKKDIKTTYKTQIKQLEKTFMTARKWKKSSFINIFIDNPVMREFGTNLVWGTYSKEDKLIQSFRCLEDGSLTTYDEENFELSETDIIGLVHPIELNKEILESWKEQLEDYEITEPFEQLNRKAYKDKKHYENKKTIEIEIDKKLLKYGWKRGEVLDHGIFYEYCYENKEENIKILIKHNGIKIRNYENKELEIKSVDFLDNYYNKIENWEDIPKRFYSEIIKQLEEVIF